MTIIYSMFRKKIERSDSNYYFEPCFYRVIGVEDSHNYNNILKTLNDRIEEYKDITLLFENSIPMLGEMELIQYIYNELNTMDITNMQAQDIVLFDDENINRIFLESLDYIIPLSIKNENFFNENIRNNFITKLIVWTYSFVKNINFNSDFNPKCIYYGQISRHEIYFLIMLHLMDFDVVYINPLKEEFFEEIDTDKLSELKMSMNIEPLETFKDRAAKGNTIDNVETITKQIERDITETLFADTGIYKPWQYRSGYTKRILLDTILEDIYIYWNEPAKLRTGFRVENNVVSVPCFFYKIDGQFINDFEFQRLVKFCTESKNTLFFNDGRISSMNEESDDMYSLMFCQLSDGTFDIEEVKKTSIYRFGKYSNEVQNLILNKFNEIIVKKDIFNINLDKEKILRFFALVLSMDEQIIRMIDNFDFTGNVPKLVVYLNNEDEICELMTMLLGYLNNIGIDIVIFNPSGLFNINNIIKNTIVKVMRLEQMNYTSNYGRLIKLKKSMISKILRI